MQFNVLVNFSEMQNVPVGFTLTCETAVFNTPSKRCVLPPQLKTTEEEIMCATFNQNKQ
jgi:hypothetical protein